MTASFEYTIVGVAPSGLSFPCRRRVLGSDRSVHDTRRQLAGLSRLSTSSAGSRRGRRWSSARAEFQEFLRRDGFDDRAPRRPRRERDDRVVLRTRSSAMRSRCSSPWRRRSLFCFSSRVSTSVTSCCCAPPAAGVSLPFAARSARGIRTSPRQLLVESVLISTTAGVIGLGLSAAFGQLIHVRRAVRAAAAGRRREKRRAVIPGRCGDVRGDHPLRCCPGAVGRARRSVIRAPVRITHRHGIVIARGVQTRARCLPGRARDRRPRGRRRRDAESRSAPASRSWIQSGSPHDSRDDVAARRIREPRRRRARRWTVRSNAFSIFPASSPRRRFSSRRSPGSADGAPSTMPAPRRWTRRSGRGSTSRRLGLTTSRHSRFHSGAAVHLPTPIAPEPSVL